MGDAKGSWIEALKAMRAPKHPSDAISPPVPPHPLEELRYRLEVLRRSGTFDSDVDGAYWSVTQALRGHTSEQTAKQYAEEVLTRYEPQKPVASKVEVRTISKAEHDAISERPTQRGIDREEYERLLQEAQE